MKVCSKCGVEKDESEFSKNKKYKDGLNIYCKKCNKEYYNENKEYYKKYNKKYQIENKDKIRKQNKKYQIENNEKVKKYHNNWSKQRKLKDPLYKLRKNISSKISIALKKQNSSKFGKSIIKYIPYTINELKQHIESQWEQWMNWDNYGISVKNKKTWNIDHIIPQSLLPYNSMEDENFRKCWDLSNLRPMDSIENIKKSNKIEPK